MRHNPLNFSNNSAFTSVNRAFSARSIVPVRDIAVESIAEENRPANITNYPHFQPSENGLSPVSMSLDGEEMLNTPKSVVKSMDVSPDKSVYSIDIISSEKNRNSMDISPEKSSGRASVSINNLFSSSNEIRFSGNKRNYYSHVTGIDDGYIDAEECNRRTQRRLDVLRSSSNISSATVDDIRRPLVSADPFIQNALNALQSRIDRINAHNNQLSR